MEQRFELNMSSDLRLQEEAAELPPAPELVVQERLMRRIDDLSERIRERRDRKAAIELADLVQRPHIQIDQDHLQDIKARLSSVYGILIA